ncbi:auxilin-like protein SWA2 [Sporobolomyces koalae]|uniref:auxilin-like protein SWA2 n=1 Tax=Sporobolomyces koalae TaxID=500713 RepID=UPI0031763EEB
MDDLLDLDFSKPHAAPQQQYGRSAFDYLAKSSATASSAYPSVSASKPLSANGTSTRSARANANQGTSAGGDAFSSLFSTTSSAASSAAPAPANNVPMAQRLQPSPALTPTTRTSSPQHFANLQPTMTPSRPNSSLSSHNARTAPPAVPSPSVSWDFDLLSKSVPPPVKPSTRQDPFDLGFDQPSSTFTPRTETDADDFDLLGAFSQPASSTTLPSPPPVASAARQDPEVSVSTSARNVTSPPPAMLLKLTTELGFPLPEANAALLTTFEQTGQFDLERAVEVLTNTNEPARSETNGRVNNRDVDEWGDDENVRIGRRRSWEHDDDDQRDFERRHERTRKPPSAQAREPARPSRPESDQTRASQERDQAKILQDQATEVLQQAQKLGLNMFKSANTFWGLGKEALAKKIEEQRIAARGNANLRTGANHGAMENGKPKWWREGMDELDPPSSSSKESRSADSGFKDSDDEAEPPESVLPQRPHSATSSAPPCAPPIRASTPQEYRSPFRRAKAATATPPAATVLEADLLSSNPNPTPAPTRSTTVQRPMPTSAPTVRAVAQRARIPVSRTALSESIAHKQTGNEHFKLGRFSDACTSYTLALSSLPEGWIGSVVLLNNRAQSRIKSGGAEKDAVADCTRVLEILLHPHPESTPVGSDSNILQSLEAETQTGFGPEVTELVDGTLDLKDQFGKSLGRRAKSLEVVEKWDLALKDWERVRQSGDEVVVKGAGGGKVVGDGIARCRKMLNPAPTPHSTTSDRASSSGTSTAPITKPKPKPTPKPRPTAPVQGSGEAVKALRAAQALQLAEDDLKLSLKDSVDERIGGWKNSKETNLRALIASLDKVLWPELGWKQVGMNELITENQLKVRYVRAIAKVHPDKLSVGNTTVEQRMIAGAVFAALNEAWNATKA